MTQPRYNERIKRLLNNVKEISEYSTHGSFMKEITFCHELLAQIKNSKSKGILHQEAWKPWNPLLYQTNEKQIWKIPFKEVL